MKLTKVALPGTIIIFLIILSSSAFSQNSGKSQTDTVKHWKLGGTVNLNFSQIGLYNWAGGGQSMISATGGSNLFLNYSKGKDKWENTLDLSYGIIRQGDKENEFRKSDDELNFVTKYTHDLNTHFNFSGFIDFKTSMTKGYNYPVDEDGNEQEVLIADFMAPGYLISSVGVDYSPTDNIAFTLSPLTGKTTFMLNEKLSEQGRYGVPPGEKVRQEFGSNLNISIKGILLKNVSYKTEANFFSAYKTPKEIDVNWKTQINLRVNKYLVTTINANLIYDEDIDVTREDGTVGPAVQFKEVLAIGFNYEFQ